METVDINGIVIVNLTKEDSSFVSMIMYNKLTHELEVTLNYGVRKYKNIPESLVIEFLTAESIGLFYNTNIKTMAKTARKQEAAPEKKDQPKRTNHLYNSDGETPVWIDFDIDVTKIDKAWLYPGAKGIYLKGRIQIMPEGETNKFGKLGMIVQSVPKEVHAQDKERKGIVLGNLEQIDWNNDIDDAAKATTTAGDNADDIADDLPF